MQLGLLLHKLSFTFLRKDKAASPYLGKNLGWQLGGRRGSARNFGTLLCQKCSCPPMKSCLLGNLALTFVPNKKKLVLISWKRVWCKSQKPTATTKVNPAASLPNKETASLLYTLGAYMFVLWLTWNAFYYSQNLRTILLFRMHICTNYVMISVPLIYSGVALHLWDIDREPHCCIDNTKTSVLKPEPLNDINAIPYRL